MEFCCWQHSSVIVKVLFFVITSQSRDFIASSPGGRVCLPACLLFLFTIASGHRRAGNFPSLTVTFFTDRLGFLHQHNKDIYYMDKDFLSLFLKEGKRPPPATHSIQSTIFHVELMTLSLYLTRAGPFSRHFDNRNPVRTVFYFIFFFSFSFFFFFLKIITNFLL